MDESKRCVAHSSRTGERCKRARCPGATVCPAHGGSIGRVKAAAQRRVEASKAAEIAERIEVDMPRFDSPAAAVRYLVDEITRRGAQFGRLADDHGDDLTYVDRAGTERLRAAVIGQQKWLESLARVLGVLVQADAAAAAAQKSTPDDLLDQVSRAIAIAATNVSDRHRELGDGFRDELVTEIQRVFAVWNSDHPEPDHRRTA